MKCNFYFPAAYQIVRQSLNAYHALTHWTSGNSKDYKPGISEKNNKSCIRNSTKKIKKKVKRKFSI